MLVALSALSSGVPVKPMNIASGSSCLHRLVHLAALRAVASSTKTKRLPLAAKSVGSLAFSSVMKSLVGLVARRVVVGAAELVDQRADQPLAGSG